MAKEIRLPDIGDFKDVPVIEILVAPGQSVRKDEPLLTLESDKASMDVPAPEDGVIGEIHVKIGDKLTQGDLLATYSSAGETQQAAAPQTPKATAATADAEGGVQMSRPQVHRRRRLPTPADRPISRPISWFSAPVPAAIPPPSAPPISGRTSFWLIRDRR
jgi:pyruvate/2-oxoglutarate dehydrogenase complex dihydrolipoamide acyltransferase (E2) component